MFSISEMDQPTVLLVDDDDQVRGLCRMFLEESGFQVFEAPNGLEALLLAVQRQGAFDLVVTDLVMPNMTGVELGKALREMWPHLNVLYMSGSCRETAGLELPSDSPFLAKPFALQELVEAVDGCMHPWPKSKAETQARLGAITLSGSRFPRRFSH